MRGQKEKKPSARAQKQLTQAAQLSKIQSEHRRAHHVLDELRAPIVDDAGAPYDLQRRLEIVRDRRAATARASARTWSDKLGDLAHEREGLLSNATDLRDYILDVLRLLDSVSAEDDVAVHVHHAFKVGFDGLLKAATEGSPP